MRRNSNGGAKIGVVFVLFVVLGLGVYMGLNSPSFERNSPVIVLEDEIYWNLTTPLNLNIKDDTGLKNVKIDLIDGENVINLADKNLDVALPEVNLEIAYPKGILPKKDAKYELSVEASDTSKWNFTLGNSAKKVSKIIIDNKKPLVTILNQSYKITKGGTAVVVFKASDEMMSEVYISTNYGKIFKPTKFIKDGYYASLVAWPANINEFSAEVIAVDKAGNKTNSKIRYFFQDKQYRVSKIALSDEFIAGKVSELVDRYALAPQTLKGVDKFKFVNESLRDESGLEIKKFSAQIHEDMIENFFVKPFNPLKKAAAVASFGDHRIYTYNGAEVSESWHMGLDFASVANADIIESNNGVVVHVGENGIYGHNVGIYYGFGLFGIYAHCSSVGVSVGEQVKAGDIIAKTGATGFAFGDHLHFGTIVQGVEVRPEEWMDSKWMKDNIYDILADAKKTIINEK